MAIETLSAAACETKTFEFQIVILSKQGGGPEVGVFGPNRLEMNLLHYAMMGPPRHMAVQLRDRNSNLDPSPWSNPAKNRKCM